VTAMGRKATPGPLYGISRDVWSALAIAVDAALARYVQALHRRYPDGPEQLRREGLDGRAKVSEMTRIEKDPAA
jgi:hypothetical protein